MPATVPAGLVPDSFKVIDHPGDDGSEVLVVWPAPKGKPAVECLYVVEVAKSPEDFLAGRFKPADPVEPSPGALASAQPDFFGRKPENKSLYFAQVSPADVFKEAQTALTSKELDDFAAQGVIDTPTLERAKKALAIKGPKPTDSEEAEKKWLRRLHDLLNQRQGLEEFAAQGVLDTAAVERAKAALILAAKPADFKPTPDQEAELKWLGRLQAYLAKRNQEVQKDRTREINAKPYCFRLAVKVGDATSYVMSDGKPLVIKGQAEPNWFKWHWMNNLVFSLLFCGVVFAFIQMAKRKPDLFIRKIAGLEAVDEAIGRSTEMDRPVFFVHGLGSMGDLATIASVNILGRVARRAAEHDTRVRVMNNDPIVMAVSQEVVQQAYTEAGRPDAYNPDDVSLVASDQFSYVAAVSGIMVREQPGAIFILGSFYAESLLLAETGASTGAIQVAGTDAYTQLPFFITTCDYTLIGEELYAASAYLSREPRQLGSLRGQDVGKAFMMLALLLGSLALTAAAWLTTHGLQVDLTWLRDLLRASGG